MAAVSEEFKAQIVEQYKEREPTPETTMDIVKELADEHDESPNRIRMILSGAGAYIKKEPAKSTASGGTSGGSKRVSKADAQAALAKAIESKGHEPDMAIIEKMTGKAAQYFTEVLTGNSSDEE